MAYYIGLLIATAIAIIGGLLGAVGFDHLATIVMLFGLLVALVDILGFLLIIANLGGEDEE